MFTLEESALLKRMLYATGVAVSLAIVVGACVWCRYCVAAARTW